MNSQAAILPEPHAPQPITKARPHIGFFDGIRGSLCFYVMVFHAAIMSGFFTRLLPGPISVDLFMMISGFFMTYILWGKKSGLTGDGIMEFYLRRIIRVVPVYYLVLIVACTFFTIFMQYTAEARIAIPPPWAAELHNDPSYDVINFTNVIMHMTFLFGLNPHYASNLPIPDWSLTLEMQFYAIVPFLLIAFRKYGLTIPFIILILINFLALRFIGLYLEPKVGGLWPEPSLILFKLGCFLTGILLCLYFFDDEFNKIEKLGLLIISLAFEGDMIFSITVVFCFACLEGINKVDGLFARTAGFLSRFFQSKVLNFFSIISYDLYLIHMMILVTILHFLLKSDWYLVSRPTIRFLSLLGIGVIIVVPLSYLLHITVERPCQNASRGICNWVLARKRTLFNATHSKLG